MKDGSYYHKVRPGEGCENVISNFSKATFAKDPAEFDRAKAAAIRRLEVVLALTREVTIEQLRHYYNLEPA